MNPTYLPHYEWAAILALSYVLWCWHWVKPRFGLPAASLLGFLGINALWVWIWVENRYYPLNDHDQQALRYFAADSMARMMILVVPMMLLAENRFNFLVLGTVGAWFFVIINSLLVLGRFAVTSCAEVNACGGLGNPSIMMGAVVCALPIVIKKWRTDWAIFALVAAAVLVSKSSIALGLLALFIGFSFFNKKSLILAAILAPLPLVIGYFILGSRDLFSSSDRFMIWEYMMSKWPTLHNVLTGTGWGTYHVFSINLQAVHHLRDGFWWDTLHNDWLQMVFEAGIPGATLMLLTYFHALKRMLQKREFAVASSIALYGIYMGANPVLHHAIPALFGAWLFVYALRQDGFTPEDNSTILT